MKNCRDLRPEALKRQAAKLGMVFFGMRNRLPVEDAERQLSLGLEICDVLSELHIFSGNVTSVREAAFFERFSKGPDGRRRSAPPVAQMAEQVAALRKTIQRLLRCEPVKDDELALSASVCHQLYAYL